jgi:hypothetical protein
MTEGLVYVDWCRYDHVRMLTVRRPIGVSVVAAAAVLAATAPAAQAAPRQDPTAVTACASTGCTESTTLSVPPGGAGETTTDSIPANSTQGSINLQPVGPSDQQAFDGLVNTLLDNNPGLISPKLNQRSKRILTCVFLSYLPFTSEYPDATSVVVTGTLLQVPLLNACLQLALSFPPTPAAADSAGSASARCARFDAAITLQITRSRSGYRGVIASKARRPTGRSPAVISCRRSGRGLLLTIRPRVRGQKLPKVVGPRLGIAYANPGKQPVSVHTTFKVN